MSMAELQLDQLRNGDFSRLSQLIHQTCGIKLSPSKKTMLEGRLRKRVRALGLGSMTAYVAYLFEDDGLDNELSQLIDAVTTNKTDFFREPDHFKFMTETALPELAAAGRPVIAWSAAASVGAEAYSMAMVMADFALNNRGFQFSVYGTDICSDVLETAMQAIYSEEMIAPVPMEMRKRYLLRSKDRRLPTVRIAPHLRRHVSFGRLNLIDESYHLDISADIVFCRNILIYFDKPTQKIVLNNICRHMPSGAFMFIGHSETIAGLDLPLRQVSTTVYRRE